MRQQRRVRNKARGSYAIQSDDDVSLVFDLAEDDDFYAGEANPGPFIPERYPKLPMSWLDERVTWYIPNKDPVQPVCENENPDEPCTSASINSKIDGCPICQLGFYEGEGVILTDCIHYYHRECIVKYSSTKQLCAICRAPFIA